MIASVPDPEMVRAANRDELYRLGLPVPPANFPLVWEPGDKVGLRPRQELEAIVHGAIDVMVGAK